MPLWLTVVLAVVGVLVVAGTVAYLLNTLNHATEETTSAPGTGSSP